MLFEIGIGAIVVVLLVIIWGFCYFCRSIMQQKLQKTAVNDGNVYVCV